MFRTERMELLKKMFLCANGESEYSDRNEYSKF